MTRKSIDFSSFVFIYMGMFFDDKRLLLIAGPCSLESEKISLEVAEYLVKLAGKFPELQIVFKGSFDKANRTSIYSDRGPGLVAGLAILEKVKQTFHLAVTTDIHLPEQADPVGKVVDIIQIPAFLCRQTDLLVAAARTGRVISVKKGQFLAPEAMKHIVQKLKESGAREIWPMDRGTCFGYGNLVTDMRAFSIMKQHAHPVIFDVTHSSQCFVPGHQETVGCRDYDLPLARAAIAAGADGLFIETHPRPEQALSDKETQLPLTELDSFITKVLPIWRATRAS